MEFPLAEADVFAGALLSGEACTTVPSGLFASSRVNPPSTVRICPVIKVALSDNKNSTASAISLGFPTLLIIEKSVIQLGSLPKLSVSGVSTRPGATALTLTLSPKLLANDFVKDIIPAFVAEYITAKGSPIIPSTDVRYYPF